MQKNFSLNIEAFFKALILLGFSTFLLWLVISYKIIFYINPRFILLTELAAFLIFLMFLVQAGNSIQRISAPRNHAHSSPRKMKLVYLPFIVTLMMAFLLPNSPLDANMASNKGMNPNSRSANSAQSGQPAAVPNDVLTTQTNNSSTKFEKYLVQSQEDRFKRKIDALRKASLINMNEENFLMIVNEINTYPEQYVGKEITMLGFVMQDKKYPSNQFALARYVISCCTADAIPDGFMCEYANTSTFSKGSWMNIRGTIHTGKYEKNTIPVIKITTFTKADEPQNPYIFP